MNAQSPNAPPQTVQSPVDGGEAMLDAFRSLGVDYVFCSPGSEWAPVWEAVARQRHDKRPGPAYLDLWHETVAVGMATGYALVTGRTQAVLLHAAPGLLQGSCAIHGAVLAGVPMLVLSSESLTYGERAGVDPGSQWYRNLSFVGGPHALMRPLVKWANQVPGIETLYAITVRAGEMAERAPAGPVYLNVPVEVLLEPWQPPAHRRRVPPPARRVSPDAEIENLARLLLEAAHPVVITETAGRADGGFDALTSLCELLAIPVIEPQSAVCANFPRRHPLHQGGTGDALLKDADLFVLVNCRAPWYPPSQKPAHAKTIVIDDVPQRPHVVYQVLDADLYVEGEVGDTLRRTAAAVAALPHGGQKIAARRAALCTAHDALAQRLAQAEDGARQKTGVIDPVLVATLLREQLAAEAVFVDETITHSRLLQQHLQCNRASSYYYVQGGLGQGIAVALGVRLAEPERLTVLTLGDGTFFYNPVLASLQASKDNELPLLIVVFNNRQYLSMKYNHLRFYPHGVSARSQHFNGVDLSTQADIASLAAPWGMFGETVGDPARLPDALARAIASVRAGRTAILNVMVEK